MKTANIRMIGHNKRVLSIILATVLILLVPLIAMQLTDEVNWNVEDFIVIGALLFGTSCVYEVMARRMKKDKNRFIFGLVCIAAVVVVWIELAVGIFD